MILPFKIAKRIALNFILCLYLTIFMTKKQFEAASEQVSEEQRKKKMLLDA